MPKQVFSSDNDSDTMADALKAVGLAETLYAWLDRLDRAASVTIADCGDHYAITILSELDMHAVEQITHPFVSGRGQALINGSKGADVEADILKYDYDEQVRRRNNYFQQLQKLSSADRARYNKNPRAEEFAGLQAARPDADLDLYIYVSHFKAAESYNRLLRQWRGQSIEAFRANLELLLTIFSARPNAISAVEARWRELLEAGTVGKIAADANGRTTLLQFLNPSAGKGNNAYKANGLSIGNLDGFWLLEYLKFVGLFTISAPRMVRGAKDRKTYVLRPVTVARESLHGIMERFRGSMLTANSVALDILAALRFTQAFAEYLRDALIARDLARLDPLLALIGEKPRVTDIARGFDITFYKDMGSAYATMNQATINLPRWAPPIATPEEAERLIALLREHELVIGSIKTTKGDEGSDEIELLRRYRDFLSGHDAACFFEFAAHYGDYYLARRHRKQYAGQFTTAGMRELEELMAQANKHEPLLPITQNEGFRALATAIRQATVIAQYHAARENGYPYEVRYGLGQDLLRAAAYPKDFLAALSGFIQSYNAENARIDERLVKGSLRAARRSSVRADHVNEIVRLVDQHGSELVCKMLVAYGYSRDPRTPGEPEAAGAEAGVALEDEQSE